MKKSMGFSLTRLRKSSGQNNKPFGAPRTIAGFITHEVACWTLEKNDSQAEELILEHLRDLQQRSTEKLKSIDWEYFWNGRLFTEFDISWTSFSILIGKSKTNQSNFANLREKFVKNFQRYLNRISQKKTMFRTFVHLLNLYFRIIQRK